MYSYVHRAQTSFCGIFDYFMNETKQGQHNVQYTIDTKHIITQLPEPLIHYYLILISNIIDIWTK